jgi:hypothetical protein
MDFRSRLADDGRDAERHRIQGAPGERRKPVLSNRRSFEHPTSECSKVSHAVCAQNKLSAQGAGIVAVGWAGGWSTREKGGPSNSMTNIGGITPGGFYNASNVRVDSVQLQNDPVPYYLVRMSGQIGETRQTLYAAVLQDGRIIRPTPVSGLSQAIRTVAVSKSGQGVGEQKQTALKVRKSHRQHVSPAKKDS